MEVFYLKNQVISLFIELSYNFLILVLILIKYVPQNIVGYFSSIFLPKNLNQIMKIHLFFIL